MTRTGRRARRGGDGGRRHSRRYPFAELARSIDGVDDLECHHDITGLDARADRGGESRRGHRALDCSTQQTGHRITERRTFDRAGLVGHDVDTPIRPRRRWSPSET